MIYFLFFLVGFISGFLLLGWHFKRSESCASFRHLQYASALYQIRDNAKLVLEKQPGAESSCLSEIVFLVESLLEVKKEAPE